MRVLPTPMISSLIPSLNLLVMKKKQFRDGIVSVSIIDFFSSVINIDAKAINKKQVSIIK